MTLNRKTLMQHKFLDLRYYYYYYTLVPSIGHNHHGKVDIITHKTVKTF